VAEDRSTLAAVPFPPDAPRGLGVTINPLSTFPEDRETCSAGNIGRTVSAPTSKLFSELMVAIVMSDPKPLQQPNALGGLARRTGVSLIIAGLLFGLLWYTVFDAMTAAFVASGGTVLLVAGANTSDAVATVFETLGVLILTVLSAIGAFLFGILSIFQ
jgi:hypothetical protein